MLETSITIPPEICCDCVLVTNIQNRQAFGLFPVITKAVRGRTLHLFWRLKLLSFSH